jgi:hypothetical protein
MQTGDLSVYHRCYFYQRFEFLTLADGFSHLDCPSVTDSQS